MNDKIRTFTWNCPKCGNVWNGIKEESGEIEITSGKVTDSRNIVINISNEYDPVVLIGGQPETTKERISRKIGNTDRTYTKYLHLDLQPVESDPQINPGKLQQFTTYKSEENLDM